SDACSSFDGSTLTHILTPQPSSSLTSGVTDARGIQAMLSKALGQQTHIGKTGQPIGIGPTVPTHHTDWVFEATELACADFDENCRWKNVEGLFVDQMDWYQGSGFLDQGRLQVATGTHISPGTYWSSPEVHIRVCTRKSSALLPTGYDYCSPPLDDPKPGPVRVVLPDSGREPFQIFIIADNFVYQATSLQGGFAIIDEIEYDAAMCGEEGEEAPGPPSSNSITPFPKLVDLNEKEHTTKGMVMKSTITRRGPLPISPETREFIKTIEEGREEEEDEQEEGEEETAVGHAMPRPAKKFIAARENMSREDMRASRNKRMSLRERVASRDRAGQSNGVDEEKEEEVREMSLADFTAMSVDGSIDRFLSMMKEVYHKTGHATTALKSACDVLNCRFIDGDCDALLAGSEWHTSDRPVGNPLTGIRGDASLLPYNKEGSFAYIRGPRTHSRLQTSPFHLDQDAFFIFAYHKIDPHSSLRVYAKQAGKEKETLLFDAPVLAKNSSRRWFREGRVLPAGDYDYIVFEVHSLSANNYIGLDEILVLNVDRQLMCT
ncbi:hypothetical protein PMAYCL1PPCAC_01254, partial [Pristionchus mayeri]